MIPNYTKNSNKPLNWDNELEEKFVKLQHEVANCCKLYFIDDTSPIFLHTDASNYGIGGYLYQMIDDQKIPIQFLNKKLNKTELKWNTVEKEAFAIFYSFMKLEHLLRDRHFTLKTDSQILSHMNVDHKEKVKRWKIAIQHYDFNVQHIKGSLNVEADWLSRLVPPPNDDINLTIHMLSQTETVQTKKFLKPTTYQKIKLTHNSMIGHGGIQRTIDILKQKHEKWKGMRDDVTTFINNCPCCQKMRRLKPIIHTIPFTLASYEPMRRVCIDAIGPINISGQEYKHIMVIIDAFSRYVKLFPLKAVTSEEAVHAFNQWVADFGCPSEIVSDNASYFVSELIKSFNEATGIKHSTIHPYSHEENGIVERANQEVIRHLTAMIADKDVRKSWPKYLPFVQRIMNTLVKTTTGASPTEMIYGNSINHDHYFLDRETKSSTNESHHDMIKDMIHAQEKIITIAQKNQENHDIHVVATRSKESSTVTHFPINSYVLVTYETQKETKLHTTKHGPYRVLNHIGTVYTVEHLVTGEIKDFHVTKLSEYNVDEDNEDIIRAAKIDDEYADITSVIDHKFVPPTSKRRTSIQFLLTWEDDTEPKWYPWNATLGGNELIHEYLNNKRMRQYIPQKYTHPKDHPEEIARREEMKNKRNNENNKRNNKRN